MTADNIDTKQLMVECRWYKAYFTGKRSFFRPCVLFCCRRKFKTESYVALCANAHSTEKTTLNENDQIKFQCILFFLLFSIIKIDAMSF